MSNTNISRITQNTKKFLNQVNADIKNSIPGEYTNAKEKFRQNIVEDLEEGDDNIALEKYMSFIQNPRKYLMKIEEKYQSNTTTGGRRRTKRSKKSNRRTRHQKK